MKKVLALVCILLLCLSLLLYSIFEERPAPVEQTRTTQEPNASSAETTLPEQTQPEETTVKSVEPAESLENTAPTEPVTQLYFLNGQPVLQLIWDQLSEEFARQTQIHVKTVSSQDNLQGQKPVLFSISGAEELGQWPCLDLADTVAYANLACSCFTLTQEEKVCGIASEAEPFGVIYNTALLATAGYTASDIDSFADLKTVAQLITDNQEKLEFGAFAQPDEAGRMAAILAAVPEDIRLFWDLYSSNLAPGSLSEGKAVFQLGTLTDMERLSASGELQLQMLPLYTGTEGEENRGLYCFGKHYWCIREDASQEEITAALAFLNFLVSPRTDGTVPVDDLALLAPYRQAVYANNSVEERLRSDIALGKELIVCGSETPAPAGFAEALLTYATDPTDENWATVEQFR